MAFGVRVEGSVQGLGTNFVPCGAIVQSLSHKVFLKSLRTIQFLNKSVDVFFILIIVKDMLTHLREY